MKQNKTIVFICEHGAAKSIVAAAYFNQLAAQAGLDLWAVARGTNPDQELSPQTVKGLAKDHLTPSESVPQELTEADLQSARRIIAFCELPAEYQYEASVERWDDIPPVSENYEAARNAIVKCIHHLVNEIK